MDWDAHGTRFTRVGLTLAEARVVLGVTARTSTSEIRKLYHRMALANHPDKLPFEAGSHEAAAASQTLMKARVAFETVMKAKEGKVGARAHTGESGSQ
jgi:DnaJ-class molecular chaperone